MMTHCAPARKRQRFNIEMKIAISSSQRDGLDALAQRTDSTRAHEVRQAIARHLRAASVGPVGALTLTEAREAREYLADIQARLEGFGLCFVDGSDSPEDASTSLQTGPSA